MILSNDSGIVADAAAIQCLRVVETTRIDTAATDGVCLLINPNFLDTLNDDQVMGLLVHEICHVRFRHNERLASTGWLDHSAANRAMDREINPIVESAGYVLPPDGLYPDSLGLPAGLAWEEYYPHEQASPQDAEPEGGAGEESPESQADDKGSSGSSNDTGSDGDSSTGESGSGDSQGESGAPSDSGGGQLSSGVHPSGSLVAEFAGDLLDELATPEKLAEQVAEMVKDSSNASRAVPASALQSQPGTGSGDNLLGTGELVEVPAGTRWQDVVIDLIGERRGGASSVDWTRRNRRSHGAAYMPARKRQSAVKLALVVDVSGSCVQWFGLWSSLLAEMVEELREISELEIIYHDTRVKGSDRWERTSGSEPVIESIGGGGTSHVEALTQADSLDVDAIVMFTDSESVWPGRVPAAPCITVQPPGSYDVTPFGKTIRAFG